MACWVKVNDSMRESRNYLLFSLSKADPDLLQACITTLLLSPVHMRFSLHTHQLHFCAEKRIYALQLYSGEMDEDVKECFHFLVIVKCAI